VPKHLITLRPSSPSQFESEAIRSGEDPAFGCYKVVTRREISAGVVLVRRMRGRAWFAAVRPQGKPVGVWALPKGLIASGEDPAETALREAFEETGLTGRLVSKLGDIRYVYTWQGERVFKIVSFYLARSGRGRIGELPAGMEIEVAEARWLPLGDAARLLAYRGERDMAERARAALGTADRSGSGPI
jgi:8-oxo-dGTP pyrophosphatase MutT (NUDIX family)